MVGRLPIAITSPVLSAGHTGPAGRCTHYSTVCVRHTDSFAFFRKIIELYENLFPFLFILQRAARAFCFVCKKHTSGLVTILPAFPPVSARIQSIFGFIFRSSKAQSRGNRRVFAQSARKTNRRISRIPKIPRIRPKTARFSAVPARPFDGRCKIPSVKMPGPSGMCANGIDKAHTARL